MLRRHSALIVLTILAMPVASGQTRGILGLPDRIMSSSRIGRVSVHQAPELPAPDPGRISFPGGGDRSISLDYDFFNYLSENELRLDAKTLACQPYAPSDTLDFIRAKVLFSDRKPEDLPAGTSVDVRINVK